MILKGKGNLMLEQKDLILEIAREVRDDNAGKNDWFKVAHLLASRYGVVKSPNGCKKMYQRYTESNVAHITSRLDENRLNDQFERLEIRGDGTQISERVIQMSETDKKNPAFVMEAHGYDSNEWDLISTTNNFWKVQTSDGDLHNYQSKISVKPKVASNELTKQDIIDLIADFKPIERDFKLKSVSTNGQEKLALEIDFSDVHIGSLSWHEEVGEDNDYKIAFETLYRYVQQAKEIIDLYPVEELYLCFLGDFLQVDTEGGTTTKGTQVDLDSRPKKMVSKAMDIVMYIIEELAIVKTNVYWIEGNHSRLVEYTLFQSLPYIYQNAKHISFDVSPRLRKAFMYGDNLIGLHHGEMNKNEMFNWLQTEFREMWGKAKYAEQHSGHIHQEKVTEKGGIIQRTNPTPKVQDLYEYENGWKSEKTSIAYLWSKKNKLKAQFYLR